MGCDEMNDKSGAADVSQQGVGAYTHGGNAGTFSKCAGFDSFRFNLGCVRKQMLGHLLRTPHV